MQQLNATVHMTELTPTHVHRRPCSMGGDDMAKERRKQNRAKPMNEDICDQPDSLEATAEDLAVPYRGGVKGRGHDSKSSKQRRFSPPHPSSSGNNSLPT